ncbi:MAG: hypothetical protein HC906_08915 [Bacteroidales bacterium]|nr:hypothetical protein [Bacteroidales bacterium]
MEKKNGQVLAHFKDKEFIVRSTQPSLEIARPYKTAYLSFYAKEEFAIYTGKEKNVQEIKEIIQVAQANYNAEAAKYGDLGEAFNAIRTVLGWNTLYDADLNRIITPVQEDGMKPGKVLFCSNGILISARF